MPQAQPWLQREAAAVLDAIGYLSSALKTLSASVHSAQLSTLALKAASIQPTEQTIQM